MQKCSRVAIKYVKNYGKIVNLNTLIKRGAIKTLYILTLDNFQLDVGRRKRVQHMVTCN